MPAHAAKHLVRSIAIRAQGSDDADPSEASTQDSDLRAELERLRYVADAAGAGVWDFRIDTRALHCSARWYEILGLSVRQQITSIDQFRSHIHPDDVERATEIDFAALAELTAAKRHYQIVFRIVRPSGEVRWVRSTACVVLGTSGVPRRAVGFIVDVTTEHLLAESQREQVHIAENVGEATRAVERSQKPPRSEGSNANRPEIRQLEAAMIRAQNVAAIGQLLSGIVHDFRNALQSIDAPLMAAEFLAKEGHIADAARLIATARVSAKHASGVARRLLNLASGHTVEPAVIDTGFVVREFVNQMRGAVGAGINIALRCNDTWPVVADPNQLESALLNLCVNSRNAMPRGGWINIEVADVTVNDASAAAIGLVAGEYVQLVFADSGAGMPEEARRRALEPFFTTRRQDDGTGLGLFMVATFARSAGGQLRIASESGQGTTVTLYLPRYTG